MSKDEERRNVYGQMLRALALRQGGSLRVEPEELTEDGFALFWRVAEDGGLELKIDDGTVQ